MKTWRHSAIKRHAACLMQCSCVCTCVLLGLLKSSSCIMCFASVTGFEGPG